VMVTGALVGAAIAPLATEAVGPRPAFVCLAAMTALLLLIARVQVPERTSEPTVPADSTLSPSFT